MVLDNSTHPDIYYHYLIHDYGSRDDYDDDGARDDNHSGVNNYNGGRKGYYNPAVNYDYLYDDDSGSTASPATAASAANNDRACDNCCGDHDNCC